MKQGFAALIYDLEEAIIKTTKTKMSLGSDVVHRNDWTNRNYRKLYR